MPRYTTGRETVKCLHCSLECEVKHLVEDLLVSKCPRCGNDPYMTRVTFDMEAYVQMRERWYVDIDERARQALLIGDWNVCEGDWWWHC